MPTHDPCARNEQTQFLHGDICICKSNVPWVSDDFPLPLCAEELAMSNPQTSLCNGLPQTGHVLVWIVDTDVH